MQIQVPALTLTAVFEGLAEPGGVDQEIHWMKIDVEGMEANVLAGWDNAKHRPWIIVVEATVPTKQTRTGHLLHPLLEAADYEFVYFDGLNRFYLAREKAALKEGFSRPPNFFDLANGVSLAATTQWVRPAVNAAEAQAAASATALTARLEPAEAAQAEATAALARETAETARLKEAAARQEREVVRLKKDRGATGEGSHAARKRGHGTAPGLRGAAARIPGTEARPRPGGREGRRHGARSKRASRRTGC